MRNVVYKPLGIGMLVGAAIGGIIAAFPLIVSAMKSMHSASQQNRVGRSGPERRDADRIVCTRRSAGGLLVMIWIAFTSVRT